MAMSILGGVLRDIKWIEDSHVTSNSWISVDPPGSANARLSVYYTELIKTKDLLQTTSHSNSRFASANDKNRIISVGVGIVAIVLSYRLTVHLVGRSCQHR